MKVFLSHSHADAPLAARVSAALQRSGLEVWDTDLDVLPGDNWAAAVGRALEESEAMVVLLTPGAINSPNVRREIEYALGAKRYSNRLIPVAVGDRARLPTHEYSVDRPAVALGRSARSGKRRPGCRVDHGCDPQSRLSPELAPTTCVPNEVFVSHSSMDRPFVNRLVDVLRRHAISVWYSETNIQGASSVHDEIGAALRR